MLDLFVNLGIIAAGIAGLGIIWSQGVKPLYRFFRKLDQVHDYITVDLPKWQDKIDRNMEQLYPNHGTSIHDKVTRTDVTINQIKDMLEGHLADTGSHNFQGLRETHVEVNIKPDSHQG